MSIKEFDLPGVRTYDLKVLPDERGFFSEALRQDWSDFLEGDEVVQANLSMSYPGMVRAWHRHRRGQVDYFLVLKGAMKICAYDDRPDSPTHGKLVEIVATEHKFQVVRIPGLYWHGTKTVSSEPSLTMYFVSRLYRYDDPDEERRPWNDPTVIDPRTGLPFDWNRPPHK
ncbi:dTDP-4-dehydrorhamnose 3,5-epimerase family protein [Calderihabitans maritimus]|uniref:Putative dTDP-4-dehydrorhamnose 3,5-epimerase n=1 Tax=Calderihabitans maritimus TaxID=1246530 RepID=A0A1Z5HWZ8_9FIRM|nr:dTDP-4-dehydrorhamnose 3,5-epimerase family protein [Calderihabitans maritimus]GAW94059.1 putative dTDP-4-dehydrorhamnose 3,5-epimerase [Calderihabitans maritimus]